MRFAVCHLIFITIAAISLEGHADDEAEARAAFQEGVDAFEADRMSEALVSFERAYALRPSYKILFNIAQCQADLGMTEKAIQAFEKYLEDGQENIREGRRVKVEQELSRLRQKAQQAASPPPEAAPTEPPEVSTDATVTPVPQHKFIFNVAPWVSAGIAAVTLTTGIVLGAKAASLNKDLGANCPEGVCGPQYGEDIGKMDNLALSADILFIATSLFTAATVSLLVIRTKKSKRGDK